MAAPVLAVSALQVSFGSPKAPLPVVAGIGFAIAAGRTLGVVGESGSGKTMTALALMGLVPAPGRVEGSVRLQGREMIGQPAAQWRAQRGSRLGMVFQEPMSALNPVMTIAAQIGEVLRLHQSLSRKAAAARAVELLAEVGFPAPRERAGAYPHQLSGGQRQRVMIAMALACRPPLLIADEPTTALDVTIQAQILDLLGRLQREIGMALLFVSHNLAVVSEIADDIIVMYAGRIVEQAPAETLFAAPRHPYTQGLIATLPPLGDPLPRLPTIGGAPAALRQNWRGCRFAERCARADPDCRATRPALIEVAPDHAVACFKAGS